MKLLVVIIVVILVGLAIYYIPVFLKPGSANCPSGSEYVRTAAGGGWVATDPSDPWGTCVSQATIDAANNQ